ncbi:hypothetical protein IIB49_02345, partial [Patescibacteria group bacterium]|nr:hypothetical protein [Patescibacteria group bacterium]
SESGTLITTNIAHQDLHLLCLKVKSLRQDVVVNTSNQFGIETLVVVQQKVKQEAKEVCVPAKKTLLAP